MSKNARATKGRRHADADGDRWRVMFLRVLEESGSVSEAVAAAGVDSASAYAARAADQGFASAWDEAAAAAGLLSSELAEGSAAESERAVVLLDDAKPKGLVRPEGSVEDDPDRRLTLGDLVRLAAEERESDDER